MTQEEIRAIVLKVIRANEYIGANRVWILIKEILFDIPDEDLRKAIRWLYERA